MTSLYIDLTLDGREYVGKLGEILVTREEPRPDGGFVLALCLLSPGFTDTWAFGVENMDQAAGILKVAGANSWEDLRFKEVRVLYAKPYIPHASNIIGVAAVGDEENTYHIMASVDA